MQYHSLGRCATLLGGPARLRKPLPQHRPVLAIIAAISVLLAGIVPASPVSAASSAPVLAVYYAWYSLPSWDPNKISDLPATPYNSADTATIQRQVTEAQAAGIDAFEVDWYGPSDPDHIDQRLQTLLSVAHGTGFQVTAYVDLNLITSEGTLINDLTYLQRYYDDPSWFHINGKPFVAFYHTQRFDVLTWERIFAQVDPNHQVTWMGEGIDASYLAVFDGIHPFSIAWSPNPAAQLATFAAKARRYPGKLWMATVMPGYDDTRLGRGAAGFSVDRQNGSYYRSVWQGAIATRPDLIQITSWNEWFEGHQIEPSRTYGDRYLQITKQESDAYRAVMGVSALAPTSASPASSSGCRFVLGFATLAGDLPQQVGQCVDEEGHNPANGDALQHTSGGLLVWRKLDNWTAFTDGYRTWINGPNGVAERLNTQRFAWEANPHRLPVVS